MAAGAQINALHGSRYKCAYFCATQQQESQPKFTPRRGCTMSKNTVSEQDRKRKKALIVFQVLLYSYLLGLFLFQLHLYSISDW
jgi:hypothetical protein